jgi:hypothetical protein
MEFYLLIMFENITVLNLIFLIGYSLKEESEWELIILQNYPCKVLSCLKGILVYQLLKHLLSIIRSILCTTEVSHLKYTTNVSLHTIVCVKQIHPSYVFGSKLCIRKKWGLSKTICADKGERFHIFIILTFIISKKEKKWEPFLLFCMSYKIHVPTIYPFINTRVILAPFHTNMCYTSIWSFLWFSNLYFIYISIFLHNCNASP